MTHLEKIQEKLTELEKKRNDLLREIQADFPALFTDLWADSKLINSFSWNQYTPYFNDGDDCIFGVNIEYSSVNRADPYDDEEVSWLNEVIYTQLTSENYPEYIVFCNSDLGKNRYKMYLDQKIGDNAYIFNRSYNKKEHEIAKTFSSIISSIPESFLRDLFGDHVEITLHRDGSIETNKYDHE